MKKLFSLDQAVALIKNNDTVNIMASGGGYMEADYVYKGIEKKFLETGSPSNLTLYHVTGVGSGDESGAGRFAHEGLVKRVVGGHWFWSKRMAKLAVDEKIEAYNLPQGVLTLMLREIASGRPGLLSTVGMNTFIDPEQNGGRFNKSAVDSLVKRINFDGQDMLYYKSFPINVSIIRGTTADEDGNISTEQEGVDLEILGSAQAAYNSGGIVIAQVKRLAQKGTLSPRMVKVPGYMVTAVVVDPEQQQTSVEEYNSSVCGINKKPLSTMPLLDFGVRKFVARRAATELREGAVTNLGIGIADGVANIAAEENILDKFTFSIEMGITGGVPTKGVLFGASWNPECIYSMSSQFDFYHGGGLALSCLGMGEIDQFGNVNVSRLGNRIPGSGGFIDISQNARSVVFCGTFTNKGLKVDVKDGKLRILKEGKQKKFVKNVGQISFSGPYSCEKGQKIMYVTERAVFKLIDGKVVLTEIAPGMDLQKNILDQMEYEPVISDNLKTMEAAIFSKDKMTDINPFIFKNFKQDESKA